MNPTILSKFSADSIRQLNLTGAGLAVVLAVVLAGCSGEFDLDVGAFEIGQTEAILWTHVVPDDPDSKATKLMVVVATGVLTAVPQPQMAMP